MTTASILQQHYRVRLQESNHDFFADEPEDAGGGNTAPSPDRYLEAALASCTAITLRMYADKKGWDTGQIKVQVTLIRNTSAQTVFDRTIHFSGNLQEDQQERLLQVAKACPVSKTLSGTIDINSELVKKV